MILTKRASVLTVILAASSTLAYTQSGSAKAPAKNVKPDEQAKNHSAYENLKTLLREAEDMYLGRPEPVTSTP